MKSKGSAGDPLWYKDAIIYETHVKAFFDDNGDGIGDFRGLTRKLEYLQALGVTCLWLLPFFPSPLKDDGYDIADYVNVHPNYGTMEDFRAFIQAAHERQLQVIVELVVNHTSDAHPWFQAARMAPPGSAEREFYVWSDTVQKYRDARIIFTDTEKSNWAWDPNAQAYYWHRFFSHQPDLNFDNPAVLREVLKAMRFWLDLGVDGLRLDAIPYLVEREGTNCENLPETHAVIRQIRAELDAAYTNRMLLAEANQWPADVRPYFGEGDECHMAFHFPLMPRIFMALRLEDRQPITEIMGQTPEIPETCQWGLFLRNHDELTLEMVTDDERDYMYLAYSADPRMRLNVGIRRRLAPLMENNRRRMELMNSLLFSFPGTPIIYYGDEIGMGDNIYLGDRNGVRTPMQWTADRNAGFSRANPSRLYSPVIMDPVYGYEAINVEAQQSDPSSLLHWMRNMIALRKLFHVFGRGTLEFLHVENRKVLAYLRRYKGDQILCVANLSRFGQPLELDLSALAGMTPVEMLGYTEFPTIGREPYRLTLGPYGFFWFELQGIAEPVEVRAAAEEAEPCLVLAGGGWRGLFEDAGRKAIEAALPGFLGRQRWSGGKARRVESARVADWAWLPGEPERFALMVVEAACAGGGRETYNVPVGISTGEAAEALRHAQPEAVLCDLRYAGGTGVVHDLVAEETGCHALLQAIQEGRELAGQRGTARAFLTEYGALERTLPVAPRVVRGMAERSNSSVLFGGRLFLKLFRRLEDGANPELEVCRFLTETARFDAAPRLAGGIEYEAGNANAVMALLEEFLPNQGDGWGVAMDELSRYYERSAARRAADVREQSPSERIGPYLELAAALGRRTAALHHAFATPTDDPAFRAEPLTVADLVRMSSTLVENAATALDALKTALVGLPDQVLERAATVLSERRRIIARFRELEAMEIAVSRIRIHGNFHLGEVLRVGDDFAILDFEGDRRLPLAERRAKQLALKDVAGMLRSFGYAAHASLYAYTERLLEGYERLEEAAAAWEQWTGAAFLDAYREAAAGAAFLPASDDQMELLLEAFLLDKALGELRHELQHRPAWVGIPLAGILGLMRRW